jgi:hypothetical protein
MRTIQPKGLLVNVNSGILLDFPGRKRPIKIPR